MEQAARTHRFVLAARLTAGISMLVGPLIFLAGILVRSPYHFFFPDQLKAFETAPLAMGVAYGLFAVGTVLLWPAVMALAWMVGERSPIWGVMGGLMAMCGLFARTFHAGVDHMAFRLTRAQGAEAATKVVGDAYGAFHVFHGMTPAILFGWWMLAVGAWRTRVMNPFQAIGLFLMGWLPVGVLKGTTPVAIVGAAGLCVALLPLGWSLVQKTEIPARRILAWSALSAVVIAAFYGLGELG